MEKMKNKISKNYEIAIIGSGLSALASLKTLLNTKKDFEICVITSNQDHNSFNLNKSEVDYFKKNHLKISEKLDLNQVDVNFLKSSSKYKTNIFASKNSGGLTSFWGGGYFPKIKSKEDKRIDSFILKNFKIKTYFQNEINNKIKNFNFMKLNCKFFVDSNKDEAIIDCGKEIKNLCIKNKIDIYSNNEVKKIEFDNMKNILKIIDYEDEIIISRNILIGCGCLNTPLLLKRSDLLKSDNINIYDHKLYRIPLLNIKNILKIKKDSIASKGNYVNKLSSLETAYEVKIKKRKMFLGIYYPNEDFFNFGYLLNYLIKKNILCFSQIYLGNDLQEYNAKLNINKIPIEQKIVNNPRLRFYEKLKILKFFISNNLIPLPYKFHQKFGSSYHIYGSLKDYDLKSNFVKLDNNNIIKIIDSSNLIKIGPEPISFLLIKNSILKTEELIKEISYKN